MVPATHRGNSRGSHAMVEQGTGIQSSAMHGAAMGMPVLFCMKSRGRAPAGKGTRQQPRPT
ncbi:hypothetical protein SXCC_02360 [Gluconacetobacter sp. SXCC-1]|nr:hypothetical protein SXCC_02360 [Gluconacetobacter sp. SXCC-1]